MNWKKIIYAVATGVMVICAGACEKIMDNLTTIEGPRMISADAQTIIYVPQENVTPTVTKVYYWLIQKDTDAILGNESKSAKGGGDIFDFDFFTVTVSGQNIVLDIDENTTDCYREITINFQCEGYDPDSLIIEQLPAGQSDEE